MTATRVSTPIDEDILFTDTRIPPTTQHAEQVIEGPITRARACQLNHQVNLFLGLPTNFTRMDYYLTIVMILLSLGTRVKNHTSPSI